MLRRSTSSRTSSRRQGSRASRHEKASGGSCVASPVQRSKHLAREKSDITKHRLSATDKYKGGLEVMSNNGKHAALAPEAQPPATCPDARPRRPLLDRCASIASDAQQELGAPVDGVLLRVVRVLLCGKGIRLGPGLGLGSARVLLCGESKAGRAGQAEPIYRLTEDGRGWRPP